MLLHYFRLALRTFAKNRTAFSINLVGMSIALGCCITAYVNYQYNARFDSQQANRDHLYRIGFHQQAEKGLVPYGVAPLPAAKLLREHLQDGEQVIQYMSKDAQFRIGDEVFQEQFVYTENAFTDVFTIKMLAGSRSLAEKGNILISDKLALTYYGTKDVVGKPLTQLINGEPREFTVSGVYEAFSANSSFRFDLFTSYDNYFADPTQRSSIEDDWSRWSTTFLYLNNSGSIAAIEKQLASFIETQNNARPDLKVKAFYVEPFIGMSARAVRERNQGHWMNMPMPLAAVIAPFAMAGFLLLVACFNFMNNAIAIAGSRLKEIGIRKVVGSRRKQLILQFLAETFVFCLLALALALVWAEFLTAGWNGMWRGLEITLSYLDNPELLTALGILITVTASIAGGYPAFYISGFRPMEILRGHTTLGGINWFTKSLLVFQFSISLAAVIFALAFYFNSRYQREYDLGYSWRTAIQVPLSSASQYEALKHEVEGNPLIHSIGGTEHHIYTNAYKAAARNEKHKDKEIDVLNVGDGYFETVNVRVLQGRGFQKDQASDMRESIIVNEEFVRVFELGDQPLGQRITLNDTVQVYIIGVVKDVYLRALFQPLSPLAFRYVPETEYKYFVASTDAGTLVKANDQIKKAWNKVFPNLLYPGQLMEYRMVMALEHFDSVVMLYTFLGLVAIVMSISGLYSLMSLNLQRRTKELGIRKLLGASMPHLTFQASRLFLVIMLVSCGVGSVLGSLMVNALMDSVWEYYVAINTQVLTLAISILLTIALCTIAFKIRRVTKANPVESLRYE